MIDIIYNKLVSSKYVTQSEIEGCSQEEIDQIQKHFDLRLPKIYKDFLFKFGHKCGNFFLGTDIFYSTIYDQVEMASDLLEECEVDFELPKKAFIFASHQGYQFMYFDLDNNDDDPPVYYYMEEMEKPIRKWDHFSDFLKKSLEDHLS